MSESKAGMKVINGDFGTFKVAFRRGGKVPASLSGSYTSAMTAQKAIDNYYESVKVASAVVEQKKKDRYKKGKKADSKGWTG
jgi:hypothetical protein